MNREEKTAAAPGGVLVELPLGDAGSNFNLEKAVCSHGLFMMAPNHWDPLFKTLRRPLRLDDDQETSYMVQISHSLQSPHALSVRVFGTDSLSPQQELSLLSQVRRMLRLSVEENIRVMEFHEVHEKAKERGFGRVFRSPTLFEDMIKCMLLCNCQWSRTLSMAQALCEFQLELQRPYSSATISKDENGTISSCETTEMKHFIPNTPSGKESNRRFKSRKCSRKLSISPSDAKEDFAQNSESSDTTRNPQKNDSNFTHDFQPLEGIDYPFDKIGNFPSPSELARLDEKFLAKRCNLGYRASRIINLAREVLENRIDLRELENASSALSLSDYDKLFEKLRVINGFGSFTCSNVLMCMGFYHVIPTDSETIRHLKQVHAKSSTVRTVQEDVEVIYGKYKPFQFLAYWSEVWHFYEDWFGNFSEMPRSHFKLITAANMRTGTKRSKWIKLSIENMHEEK